MTSTFGNCKSLVRILIAAAVSIGWFDELAQAKDIVTGAGDGGSQHVKRFDGETGAPTASFFAYGGAAVPNGVRVAVGDVTGDGTADIITGLGNGTSTPPHVKVFDGRTGAQAQSFFAYPPNFSGGVFVAAGDLDGDTYDDIVTGAGAGFGTHVRVFSGNGGAQIRDFSAYGLVNADVHVAAGDVNGDGRDDIITALGPGGPRHVRVFDGLTNDEIRGFFAYDPGFSGGVYVAAGDVNGDGRDDIITGLGPGAAPHVKAFSGLDNSLLQSFFAYDPSFTGGVYVAGVAVPEPASIVMVICGLLFCPRRRRKC